MITLSVHLTYFPVDGECLISEILLASAFSSMIEGKNEEMSTSELSGGARIHYIFQSIFVKSLEVHILSFPLQCHVFVSSLL